MEQKQMVEAFTEALTNPKVVALVSTLVAKEIIRQKTTPSNVEEGIVKNHVIFSVEGSKTGTFMTVKDVTEEIEKFNSELTLRSRVFGKALISNAKVTKTSAKGRVYLIEKVVEEITPEMLEGIAANHLEVVADEVEGEDEEIAKPKDEQITFEDIKGMDLSELLDVYATCPEKIKKVKKMDADELRVKLINILGLTAAVKVEKKSKKIVEKVEQPEVDTDLLIEAVNDYEDLDDYRDHLASMSRSKLIKHINKYKMPLSVEGKDEDQIIDSILELIKTNLEPETIEIEETPAVVEKKKKDKKEKKNKKDKKKKKKK